MSRYVRNTAVLMKVDTTYGTDAAPVPATDAMLLRKFTCKPIDAKMIKVPEVRPYFGLGMDVVGMSFVSGSFEVSLASSGTLGTAPMWGRILRSCAFAETVTASARVDYTPISTSLEGATIYYYDDGVLKKALGCRCDITSFKMGYGDVPQIAVKFIGLDGGVSAVAVPSLTLTAWKAPLSVNQVNSGLVTLGGTYSAGVLSGGTTYPTRGLELNLGNAVNFIELLGGQSADITDRDVRGKITFDLTAAQEVTLEATVKAGTAQAIGMLHGVAAGYSIITYMPSVQLENPTKDDLNGRRLLTYDINPMPVVGNDELRIVAI